MPLTLTGLCEALRRSNPTTARVKIIFYASLVRLLHYVRKDRVFILSLAGKVAGYISNFDYDATIYFCYCFR
jgi:hypothetical protein